MTWRCLRAAFGSLGRLAVRGVGLRITLGGLRLRLSVVAGVRGARERSTFEKKRASKYEKNKTGQCLMLQLLVDNEKRVLFTGSDVLIDQMKKYGYNVPFLATIIKIDRYYTLS